MPRRFVFTTLMYQCGGFDADADQLGVEAMDDGRVLRLPLFPSVGPEMAIINFRDPTKTILVLGSLHTRIPHGTAVTRSKKRRILQKALEHSQLGAPRSSAHEPAIFLLVGDCNLTRAEAEQDVQPLQPSVAESNWRTV